VFEAVLLVRMSSVLPEAPLLAVALSYRLMVTLAELLAAGLVSLDAALASRQLHAAALSGQLPAQSDADNSSQ
jgi:hypothetical protein